MVNGRVSPKPIMIVQGGQWGSEAKGSIAAYYCLQRNIDFAVRTGAINAGHTVWYNGEPYPMQQLPTGWVNPNTQLVIGAGAYIHPETLEREIGWVNEAMPGANVLDRLTIDYRCGTHLPEHAGIAKDANRHHRMGATGKGCSEAVVAKIRNRNDGYQLFREWQLQHADEPGSVLRFDDTSQLLNRAYDKGAKILIEGTQGTHLDLHLGPYPFTTNRMTSAANWVAECGLAPGLRYETVLVVRTFPIRVAGNSGPMPNEIEWADLAIAVNAKMRAAGREPLIGQAALDEWQEALYEAATTAEDEGRYELPTRRDQNEDAHYDARLSGWTPEQREKHRVAASELHRDAWTICSEDTKRELGRLFEMTTVTKKLRRIANIDTPLLLRAVEINRPTSIALTFLDYVEPVLAGHRLETLDYAASDSSMIAAMVRANRFIFALEKSLGVPISEVSVGPRLWNVFPASALAVQGSER